MFLLTSVLNVFTPCSNLFPCAFFIFRQYVKYFNTFSGGFVDSRHQYYVTMIHTFYSLGFRM